MPPFPQGRGGQGDGSPIDGGNQTPRSNLNYAYPIRPGSLQQPVSNNGGGRRPAPPIPTLPQNSTNTVRAQRVPPVRPPRPQFVPPFLDPEESDEERRPAVTYRPSQEPSRSPPPYSLSEDDLSAFPSRESQRSIYIGFDPSSDARNSSTSSIGVIPSFPSVPPAANQSKRVGSSGPPSARRGTSSYYSQQTMFVSPIPEESLSSRRESYASSAAIPSGWEASAAGQQSESAETQGETGGGPRTVEEDDEQGLVRQASLGRKSRPIITQIKSSDRSSQSRSRSNGSSNDSAKGVIMGAETGSIAGPSGQMSPAQKSSPILQVPAASRSTSSLPGLAVTQGQSPLSTKSNSPSPLAQPPMAAVRDEYFPSPFEKELGIGETMDPPSTPTNNNRPGVGKRRILPRLNMDAVRDAEARGSLTSLPDLIRRATKLAAVLETGRPNSQWGGRGSFFGAGSYSGRNNSRSTDSISDILASFPPPVFAQPSRNGTRDSRTLSQWPLPGDFGDNNNNDNGGSLRTVKENRRVCGLPVWAFVLLVLLALVVITAAVIVPLQLVNLSKNKSQTSNAVTQCEKTNPCQNGGQTVVTGSTCGCVCTNGFMGPNCSEKEDPSCTTFNFGDQMKDIGVENATIGSALPRLFEKDATYSLELVPSTLLAVFSKGNITCNLQNALVTFEGKTAPQANVDGSSTKRSLTGGSVGSLNRRGNILTDSASYPTPTASGTATKTEPSKSSSTSPTRTPALDQDTIDFARVAVLYLAQTVNVGLEVAEDAQTALEGLFASGKDFGDVKAGNVTIELNSQMIKLPNGETVGGPNKTATTSSTAASSSSTVKARRWVANSDAYSHRL